jgi:hypothetical protein
MMNVLWRTLAMAGLLAIGLPARADDKSAEALTLKSAYSDKKVISDARQVRLSVKLDDKGNGSGTLTLDPNLHNDLGSTQIAITEIPVRVRVVQDDGRDAKGRRLYELKRVVEEGKVDERGEHWFLIRPLKTTAPAMLIFADDAGRFREVLTLE